MQHKQCIHCSSNKPLSDYYRDSRKLDGYQNTCKVCISGKEKLAYKRKKEANKLRSRSMRNAQIKRHYNVSIEDIEILYKHQKGLCSICKAPIILYGGIEEKYKIACVDHNHDTGKVRGLLCNKCNRGLGFFNDNLEKLKEAVNYLENNDG